MHAIQSRPVMTRKQALPVDGHFFWILCVILVGLSGCQRPSTPTSDEPVPQAAANVQTIWESLYLQGGKIGYGQTTIRPLERDGHRLVQTDSLNHLSITRFGQTTEQDVRMSTVETSEGVLREFQTVVSFGPVPTVVSGKVKGDTLEITTATQGRSQASTLPWSGEIGGFRAVENSLSKRPMTAGEKRSFKMLMPLVNQVADVELTAGQFEETDILGTSVKLLRVDMVTRLPEQAIASTLWMDSQGEVLKTHVAALDQASYRTTEAIAKSPAGAEGTLDLGLDLFVKVEPPLSRPHETNEVVYRVELVDGDPEKVFARGPTQQVKSLGPHAAEVTVRRLDPRADLSHAPVDEKPGPEYLAANSVLQLDDARLKQMAAEAKGPRTRPAEVAVALEKYVHGAIQQRDFSQGFATAAEVAESRAGDCTEHAVLLAALARICGLPSRVAIGLVYVEGANAFGYHMWTEVFVDGRWIPLDATLGRGVTSAAYLKLNDSSLEGASAYSSFLSVAQVLGQLKVSVVSASTP